MIDRRIVVTGMGAVTPVGIGVEQMWQGLCSGRPTTATDPDLAGLPVDISCRVPGFDSVALLGRKLSWRTDRFIHFGLIAAREAVADAGLSPSQWNGPRVAVIVGMGQSSTDRWAIEYERIREGQPRSVSPVAIPRSLPNMAAGEIALDLQALGPCAATATACASGATAIGMARDLLLLGRCDIAIAGGTEGNCTPVTSVSFSQMSALSQRLDRPESTPRPFDAERDGFVLGEGAGILILEREGDALARGARIRGNLAGYGASADGYHFTSPDPQGAGAVRAMRAALADAGLSPQDVGHVNAHGTGTPMNDLAEGRALNTVFGGNPPPVTSIKSMTGHTLSASGAIGAIYTLLALERQMIVPTANHHKLDPEIDLDIVTGISRHVGMQAALSNAFAFGGQNAVLVFTRAAR